MSVGFRSKRSVQNRLLYIIKGERMVELRDRLHHQRDDALLLRTAPQIIRKEHMRRSFVPAIPLVISHLDDDGSIESSIALDLSSKSVVPPPLAFAENSVALTRPVVTLPVLRVSISGIQSFREIQSRSLVACHRNSCRWYSEQYSRSSTTKKSC
jgi:hypothetical protein